MTMPDANDFLLQGGMPSVSFDRPIGHTVTGIIARYPEVVQRLEYGTNKPMVWDDGTPQLQLKIVLATEERDPSIRDDDGLRALYARHHMKDAIRDALKAVGPGVRLDVGGRLTVTYVADAPPKMAGAKPSKLFSAQYVPPAAAAVDAMLFGNNPAPAEAPAVPLTPAVSPGQPPAYPTLPATGAPATPVAAIPAPAAAGQAIPWAAAIPGQHIPQVAGQPVPAAAVHAPAPSPTASGQHVLAPPAQPTPAPAPLPQTAGGAPPLASAPMTPAPPALAGLNPEQLARLGYTSPTQ
ncbi:UNVERIFIED_ORG: hypothetical protein FHR35_009092 [Microbispora rosea subsp. rosea]